jgi:hypothetical protein
MIFKSHLLSMILFSGIVSVLLGFLKYDSGKEIGRYALKLFIYMTGGVIIFSWVMYFL